MKKKEFELIAPEPKKRKINTTEDGRLACAYGTPWHDHFAPPSGTGKGCEYCDQINEELADLENTKQTIH